MTEEVQVDELESLKERAKTLGIKFHPSIGVDSLREKVNAAIEDKDSVVAEEPKLSQAAKVKALKAKCAELVRVRITCMNPAKKEWNGEIFTAGNSVVGTYRKMVPFEVEWHVPRIILNMIENRRYQSFTKIRTPRGEVPKTKLVKEFAVERLQPLSEKELKELAQRQAMANGTSEE